MNRFSSILGALVLFFWTILIILVKFQPSSIKEVYDSYQMICLSVLISAIVLSLLFTSIMFAVNYKTYTNKQLKYVDSIRKSVASIQHIGGKNGRI